MENRWKILSAMCVSAGCALVGCGGVTAPPPAVPTSPTYGATTASVYVIQNTSNYNDQILKFAAGSSGAATPAFTASTGLALSAVAVGSGGQIYAAGVNATTAVASINIYAANSSAVGTLAIPAQPIAIAVGSSGTIYDTDIAGEILVYPAGASSPSRTIVGSLTTIASPQAIAVDSAGTIYLTSYTQTTGASTILMFNSAANGNVAPTNTISAPSGTAFLGVAVDSAKNIYASTDSLGATSVSSIVEYAAGATAAATPVKTITGSATLLSSGSTDVGALALDGSGNLYVPLESLGASTNSYTVLEFAAGASGNATPTARVSSSAWTNAAAQLAVM